jgi:hypothetical protein
MLDSDTALMGPILDDWDDSGAPFLVDNERYSGENINLRYYDWQKVREIDPTAQQPVFVFNSGQWLGTSGVLQRDDFEPWLEWTLPRKLRHPECFFPGDQGILNYVLNQKVILENLHVECRAIMRWPGYELKGLDAKTVSERAATPIIVHWAGMKRLRQRNMVGADLLSYFEEMYYQRLPFGLARRIMANCQNSLTHGLDGIQVRARLTFRKFANAPVAKLLYEQSDRAL